MDLLNVNQLSALSSNFSNSFMSNEFSTSELDNNVKYATDVI